jgi:hypothetical protein
MYRVRARDAPLRVMHHPHQNTQTSQPHNSTTMAPIDDALTALESLQPGEKFSYRKIAKEYDVDRSTLTRRHQAITQSHASKIINQQKLTLQQEIELVKYIEGLIARHLPPIREMVQSFASTIAKEPVSESWVTRFINKHSIHLISHWTTGMDSNRHQADSGVKYSLYFNLL